MGRQRRGTWNEVRFQDVGQLNNWQLKKADPLDDD